MRDLHEKVAVVTGAASGIGLAIAEVGLAEGMRVVLADVDGDNLRAQASRLAGREGRERVHAAVTDVRDPEAVEHLGHTVLERFGALHLAVNNAGVVGRGFSWELPLDEWHRVVDVDLWGVVHGVRTFVPLILATGEEGHVVNVASMAAVLALDRLGPYTVAKHGVLGLTDVLRAEFTALGAPVGASVVMPGMVRTAMNPIGTLDPAVVAANVFDAVRHDRAYVFTDHESVRQVEDRLQAIVAARGQVLS